MNTRPPFKTSFLAELQRRHVYKVGAMYCVAGWLLVQIATQVFPFFDVSNAAVRWVVIGVIAGLVPALVLAWLFDLTPQGIVRTADLPAAAAESPVATRQRQGMDRKLNYLLGGLLALALAYLVLDHTVLRRLAASASAEQSIAVLPLANTGGDPANEYFSDGLTEELIAILARIPDLKLIGRNSSFHFKNSSEDSKSIGEKLGVTSLLEGSVRRQGDHVRIVAELVNAADGRELWSDSYDRDLKDVLAVQSEIAAAVAEQLKLKLLGAPAAAAADTPDPAAHNAVLQGDFLFQKLSEDGVRHAIDAYREAVRLDPRYALAHARLSIGLRQLAATWLSGADGVKANDEAHQAAQQALTLDPDLPRAHEALGWVLLTGDFDAQAAEAEFRRGVALAPGDAALTQALSYLLAVRGNLAEAETMARKSLAADPLSLIAHLSLSRILIATGRYDEAARDLGQAAELQPQASRVHAYLATIAILRNDPRAALQDAQLEPAGFWHDYAMTLAQQVQGDATAADAALQQFIDAQGRAGPFQIAAVYGLRKDPDRVFEWLDHAYTDRDPGLTQLMVTPMLLAYRDDPRFAALCAKLKITAPDKT